MTTTEKKLKLLFLTMPERGQCNVHHAVIHSLSTRYDNLDIHIGSFKDMEGRSPPNAKFHTIEGESTVEALILQKDGYITSRQKDYSFNEAIVHGTGFWNYLRQINKFSYMVYPDAETYTTSVKDIERLICEISADLIIVDGIFAPGLDAAKHSNKKWVILSPNTLKEVGLEAQGWGAFSWPTTGIGYTYPMPWYLVIANAIALLLTPVVLFLTPHFNAISKYRKEAGYKGLMPPFDKLTAPIVCMTTPELDYPGIIPFNINCIGPILLPRQDLQHVDPDLYNWIKERPTILVALGSHFPLSELHAKTMLEAFRIVLHQRDDIQVLWKVRKLDSNYPLDPGTERIRIVDWFKVDPTSILPHVVCVVNHGGSNSYHEALAAGVPQVILSGWVDCHDFGARLEWLKVGRWGNKKAAPWAHRDEFSKALLDVIGRTSDDEISKAIAQRAKEVSEVICGKRHARGTKRGPIIGDLTEGSKPEGRDLAADWILQRARE